MKNRIKTPLLFVCILFSAFLLIILLIFLINLRKPDAPVYMGSFTLDKAYSYDEKYYAIQEAEDTGASFKYIKVSVYESETNSLIFSFYPARALDFWGICWENDTYNIWTQSADIGIYCYKYDDEQWEIDYSAQRPEYIISKYDKYK